MLLVHFDRLKLALDYLFSLKRLRNLATSSLRLWLLLLLLDISSKELFAMHTECRVII